ncbi:MAG: hemerythrin domain-containing protein [Desulfobacterales bacterium]|jgi:hemerythrin-like domain-containing protein|nr:hemerythrin domain-containing protein [Desulfobacterales bacterium]
MQARAPLMIEHRLIERMIVIITGMISKIEKENKADPVLIDTAVDFIRTYADKTHHGKEEEILFRDLKERKLSEADRRLMNDLIEEHVLGRKLTGSLIKANDRYRNGDSGALSEIISGLRLLIDFYPKHIEKEDKVFFPAARQYFSEQEDQAMLEEFWEFDRKMIHDKYISVVETLGNG